MTAPNPMKAKVHIAKKDLKLDDETYRAILKRITGKTSSADLSDRELSEVLAEFKRLGWVAKKGAPKAAHPISASPEIRKVFAVWADMCDLGIPTIANRAGLVAFVQRMTKTADRHQGISDPNFLAPDDARKVTEALKAWRARELAKRGQP